MTYGGNYIDEDLHMYYRIRIRLTSEENEYVLGYFFYVEPKTINNRIPPGIFDMKCKNIAFRGSVEVEADEKSMTTILTTYHEIILTCKLIVVLGVTKKIYPVATHLIEKRTFITYTVEANLKCKVLMEQLWMKDVEIFISFQP